MRNLFLAVLVVNVFVFMFYYYSGDGERQTKKQLPANVNKLVLLSELDKAALTKDNSEIESTEEKIQSKQKQVAVKKCFTIGPFREETEIKLFRSKIKKQVSKTGVRDRTEKLHWRYWVYLPDAGSKQKAVKLASDLAKKGLKDYYVIARGEYKNSISLGHFKDKLLAQKRVQSIAKMSYKPNMKAIEKEYTLYWLDFVVKNQHGFSSQELEGFGLEESIHQFKRECGK